MQKRLDFAHLRFSPSILKRLGEELNPNPDHGLLELVKNAYDADAFECSIEFRETNELGGSVVISDDGEGMDHDAIEGRWLVLGESSKSPDHLTKLGRRPVGSKGLGRLAVLRLGDRVSLVSRPDTDPQAEYRMEIDWREFADASVVEDVDLKITRHKRTPAAKRGTVVTLRDLRCRLTRTDVKRLARGMLLLADPFAESFSRFSAEIAGIRVSGSTEARRATLLR